MNRDVNVKNVCQSEPEAGFLNNHFFGTWNFPTKGGSRKILEIGFFKKV